VSSLSQLTDNETVRTRVEKQLYKLGGEGSLIKFNQIHLKISTLSGTKASLDFLFSLNELEPTDGLLASATIDNILKFKGSKVSYLAIGLIVQYIAYLFCMIYRGINDDKPNEGNTIHMTGEFLLPWFYVHLSLELF
jgi:hypothetical protein